MSQPKKAKKTKRVSPTVLSLRWFRSRGMPAVVVERYISFIKIRQDIWGADIQALTKTGIVGVQAGIAAHHAEKIKKATASDAVKHWLASPSRIFFVQTWKRRPAFKKNGGRKKIDEWASRLTQLVLIDGRIEAREFKSRE